MKMIVISLMAVLVCSCRQAIDSTVPESSQGELCKMMDEYLKVESPDYAREYEFEFRGPLTITQVEAKLAEDHRDDPDLVRKGVVGGPPRFVHPDWIELKSKYRDGDAFYFFRSDERSWAELMGEQGYMIVHNKRISATLVTLIN